MRSAYIASIEEKLIPKFKKIKLKGDKRNVTIERSKGHEFTILYPTYLSWNELVKVASAILCEQARLEGIDPFVTRYIINTNYEVIHE